MTMSIGNRRFFCALLALLVPASLEAAGPPAKFDQTLRRLERDISRVRGLKFKKPVVARIIPRPPRAERGIQGYYSTKDKALYVYNDVRGSYAKGVLIHEMVHALQDQHFGLDRLHAASYGSDRELALAALVEGDANFTMIELLRKEQPPVLHMLAVQLEKARDLQRAFLYAQGARYVQAIHKREGWRGVNMRYLFTPRSTASILHPEGVSAIDLGPGKRRGEYGLIHLLAGHSATRAEAVKAAAGWRGDRVIEDGPARAWVVAFAGRPEAQRFQSALARLRTAQKPGWKVALRLRGVTVWTSDKGAWHAVRLNGAHVLEYQAPDKKSYEALRARVDAPPALTIYSAKDRRNLTFAEFIERLSAARLVCVGETHDSDLHHRVQMQIIRALFARDKRLGVGMEMFQRPYQKAIDRYLAGKTKEEQFLADSEYKKRWGYDWSLYRPIVEFCRTNKLPLAALNAPRELTRRISKVGFNKLTDDEKKQVGKVDFRVKAHRAHHFERLARMHGKSKAPRDMKERMYQVMAVWDEYMADSAANFVKERKVRRLVVLAGSGHILGGFGIPDRAARRTGGKVATVRVEVGGDIKKLKAEPLADFIIVVK
jgi:uncharacterized iron-regulated protein